MDVWILYILECRGGALYTGITNDLDRRLAAHRDGRASKFTRARLPVRLVYTERWPDRSEASRREAAVKRLPRTAKLSLAAKESGAHRTEHSLPVVHSEPGGESQRAGAKRRRSR